MLCVLDTFDAKDGKANGNGTTGTNSLCESLWKWRFYQLAQVGHCLSLALAILKMRRMAQETSFIFVSESLLWRIDCWIFMFFISIANSRECLCPLVGGARLGNGF